MKLKKISIALACSSVMAIALSSPVVAADAVYAEPAPVAPVVPAAERFGWSGGYVGVFGGLTSGDFDYDAGPTGSPALLEVDVSGSGMLGGVQAGYDWQAGNWVFGAVADIAVTNHEASLSGTLTGLGSLEAESQLKYLGTVRARVGYAADRALVYAHGGFAYGETEQTITALGTTLFDESTGRNGWTIGAGVEYAFTDRVSLATEYAYVDLGSEEVFSAPGIWVDEDVAFHTLKAAVNFRF